MRPLTLFIILLLGIQFSCSKSEGDVDLNYQSVKTFSLQGAPEYTLVLNDSFRASQNAGITSIGEVTTDESGTIYFVDNYELRIFKSTQEGTILGAMGRAGGRPGEFQKLGSLSMVRDTLYGFDEDRKIMNVYSTERLDFISSVSFVKPQSLQDTLPDVSLYSAHLNTDGSFLLSFQNVKSPTDRELYFFSADASGDITSDLLLSFKNKPFYLDEGPNGLNILMMPYERETLFVTDSGRNIFTLFTSEFILNKYSEHGTLIESWKYPFQNKKLNRSEAIEQYNDVAIRRAIRGANLPREWPAVAKLIIDNQDRLWVATITNTLDIYRWYVIDREGVVNGTFEIPRTVDIRAIHDSSIYGVTYNQARFREVLLKYTFE